MLEITITTRKGLVQIMKKKHLLLAGLLTVAVAAICIGCDGGKKEDPWNTGLKSEMGTVVNPGKYTAPGQRIGVHDPSIEYDTATGQWYIFGSHTDFAKTSNLITWTKFSQNNGGTYGAIFAQSAEWAKRGKANYDVKGNLWAPDVIYNHDLKKWCMYMSVNGDNYYSSIAMATADSIEGPYTYQGTIVFSGFTNEEEVACTDYEKVTGEKTPADRYLVGGKWNNAYGTNAIDPCVLYDKDGQLWMVYGSWFGGVYLLKLDNKTGLRDYDYKIELDTDASDGVAGDPYLGLRIFGGYGSTGEGPYIVWDEKAGYYYLYTSYCGLNATDTFSGYHMRLFRSENITGPYVDASGDYATRDKAGENQINKGIKIMGNYFLSSLATSGSAKEGYMSPGHNSAMVDNDGNRFLIYHTRFNSGNEGHQVRVHQQFLNEDGWLVTAPYEYLGSVISEKGYDEKEIVGTYELVDMGNTVPNGIIAPMLDTYEVVLHEDHTITGYLSGTWEQKDGSYFATFTCGDVTYKGVFFKQYDESKNHEETMTFSLIGNNDIALWGSKDPLASIKDEGDMIGHYDWADSSNLGKDLVGTVGNGTVVGATTTVEDETRGNVLYLDGLDSYIELPKTAVGHEGFTIMMWFNSDKSKAGEKLFEFADDMFTYMYVTTDNGKGKLEFVYNFDGEGEKMLTADKKTASKKWYHVAVTINSKTNRAEFYINGEKVGKLSLREATQSFKGLRNYIGKGRATDDPLYAGKYDDIYMFDYALSAEEIEEYMNK